MKAEDEQTKGGELFHLVESDLGFAHISDALDNLSDERVFNIARGSLKHIESAAKKIRRFLKKYGQPIS